jgi:short chain dehydrogenase
LLSCPALQLEQACESAATRNCARCLRAGKACGGAHLTRPLLSPLCSEVLLCDRWLSRSRSRSGVMFLDSCGGDAAGASRAGDPLGCGGMLFISAQQGQNTSLCTTMYDRSKCNARRDDSRLSLQSASAKRSAYKNRFPQIHIWCRRGDRRHCSSADVRFMSSRLSGGVVFVSGGAGGCGAAASRMFAAEGASVGILDLPSQSEAAAQLVKSIQEAGGRAAFAATDVSVPSEVVAGVAELVASLGAPTGLFNHAGTLIVKPFLVSALLAVGERSCKISERTTLRG